MADTPEASKPPGTVYTFYSYKGGVGRSMAVANAGVVMATEGRRVLLIDWDLEAPGLEVYFRKSARLVGDPSTVPGVVDLLEARARGAELPWSKCLLKAEFFGHSLDIISAGSRTDDYRRRVQQLNWEELFAKHRVGNYVDALREEWRAAYDFVLVDSRTGITDIGDVCTVLLPDTLVLMFVANEQNVDGIKDVMARAVKARSKLPVNRSKLLGVPLPARDERDREYARSIEWQQVFADAFGAIYREWLPKQVSPADALNKLYIPYVAAWSFGENIPVLESARERSDPSSLGAAYTRLASLLVSRLDWYSIAAKSSVDEMVGTQVELSKAREEKEAAEQLVMAVRRRGRAVAGALVALLLVSIGVGFWWYSSRPAPVSTDLFVGDRFREEGDFEKALQVYDSRRAFLEETAKDSPADKGVQREIGVVLTRIGSTYQTLGRMPQAVEAYDASRTILERLSAQEPDDSSLLLDLAFALLYRGDAEYSQGRIADTLASYRRAVTINERLAGRTPGDTSASRNLIVARSRLASALAVRGDLSESLALYQQSRETMKRLASEQPDNEELRHELGSVLRGLGSTLDDLGRATEALETHREAQTITEKLLAGRPDDQTRQSAHADVLQDVGSTLLRLGLTAQAAAPLLSSREIRQKIAKERPWTPTIDADMGNAQFWAGRELYTLGRMTEAARAFEISLATLSKLSGTNPSDALLRIGLANSYHWLGRTQYATRNFQAALASFEADRAITEQLAARSPEWLEWQRGVLVTYTAMARLRLARGEISDAAKALAAAEPMVQRLAGLPVDAALRSTVLWNHDKVDVSLALDDVASARKACDEGQRVAGLAKFRNSNQLLWEPTFTRMQVACARVLAREGNPRAIRALTATTSRFDSLQALSPNNYDLLQARESAERALVEAQNAAASARTQLRTQRTRTPGPRPAH
jgi:tetratricopeptide (TPR) repeat protein/Mrp family chromosome partitioning ATPase